MSNMYVAILAGKGFDDVAREGLTVEHLHIAVEKLAFFACVIITDTQLEYR